MISSVIKAGAETELLVGMKNDGNNNEMVFSSKDIAWSLA